MVFPLRGYQNLCLLQQKLGFLAQKRPNLAKNMLSRAHIGLAGSFGALLVGGCGTRAVSRKTPFYFIWKMLACQCRDCLIHRRVPSSEYIMQQKILIDHAFRCIVTIVSNQMILFYNLSISVFGHKGHSKYPIQRVNSTICNALVKNSQSHCCRGIASVQL